MHRSLRTWTYVTLTLLGLVGGYIYWLEWGCTDSCPIDSSWKWSLVRGGVIGFCLGGIFLSFFPGNTKPQPEQDPDEKL